MAGSTTKPKHNHIRLRGVGLQQYRKSHCALQGGPKRCSPAFVRNQHRQNGLTTTRMTIPIINKVGTSLMNLENRGLRCLGSAAKSFTQREKKPCMPDSSTTNSNFVCNHGAE